jgi:two-component system response regulator
MRLVFKMIDAELRVSTAQSGGEALSALRGDPGARPGVMLLDLRMPGKDGLDVLKEMKSDPHLKRIPVCVFSNGDVPKDVCDSYEFGASFYFKKPLGIEALKKFAEQFRWLWFVLASRCGD